MTDGQKRNRKNYELWKARRDKWFQENGPCKHCGTWENLTIDHINPKLKDRYLTGRKPGKDKTAQGGVHIFKWNEERRNRELANCQPLCRPCNTRKLYTDDRKKKVKRHRSVKTLPLFRGHHG